ncbi:MAG TPA: MiaB/RimO family radical SAM methylthiotransferase [Anaerolineales bacterium]
MKVFLDTVGCRLNQAEIEMMARDFRAAGHEIVAAPAIADLAVVNTCSVTAKAASDSRSKIRHLVRSHVAEIIPTGCWVTLEPERAAALPGVSRVVPNHRKDKLVREVLGNTTSSANTCLDVRVPLPGARKRTRAFIKVQDGCYNRCTFCVTTIARGASRSNPIAGVIADVQAALRGGAKEIVLTGVHLGSWGRDLGLRLRDLIRAILMHTDAGRVRLSSLEPWDLDVDFFSAWQDPRLCAHFHLPLQSGCSATLVRMRRNTTPDSYQALIQAARDVVPDAAITTDMIAGFPGETEEDFRTSLDYVSEMRLAGGHAFPYSPMPGTPAARIGDQVAPAERNRRSRRYVQALEDASRAFRREQLGEIRPVLWESLAPLEDGSWQLSGFTDNYIRVQANSALPRWNEIDLVELADELPAGLQGIITKTG